MQQLFVDTVSDDELRDSVILIFFNKKDLVSTSQLQEYKKKFLSLNEELLQRRTHFTQDCCAPSGEGLFEGFHWLVSTLQNKPSAIAKAAAPQPTEKDKYVCLYYIIVTTMMVISAMCWKDENNWYYLCLTFCLFLFAHYRLETQLEEWLSRADEPDDVFLAKLADYTLDSWDHYTHLRIAYVLLRRHGRREGMDRIFRGIKAFIENSPRTKRGGSATDGIPGSDSNNNSNRGTTFHETMTYFWVHMVHYALESSRVMKERTTVKGTTSATSPSGKKKILPYILLLSFV